MIGTWAFALPGIEKAYEMLKEGASKEDALEVAVGMVEDHELVASVGVGGLPNRAGIVELDGAFMDGDILSFGALSGVRKHKNLVGIARKLAKENLSNFLAGEGADLYAQEQGFEEVELSDDFSKKMYEKKVRENDNKEEGHDTVGMVVNKDKSICCGVSTSGLFMKRVGRVGDSPIIGNGFYADSDIAGVTATGVGEDINKGSIAKGIINLVQEGYSIQDACTRAVNDLNDLLIRKRGKAEDISVVAVDIEGNFAAATNTDDFSFVVASHLQEPTVYLCKNIDGKNDITKAPQEWIDDFFNKRIINREILKS